MAVYHGSVRVSEAVVFLAVARGDKAIDVGGGKTDESQSWDRAAEDPSISKTKHTGAFRGRLKLSVMKFGLFRNRKLPEKV